MNKLLIGHSHEVLNTVDSTNTYLKSLTKERNLQEGYLVSTFYQTLGRGQFGNTWDSKKGENMLLSVLLHPQWLSPGYFFYLNMSVCLSVLDTIAYFISGAQVKWPNDIWFGKRKLAGILIENQMMHTGIDQSIVGVGLNVNQEFDDDSYATSLKRIAGVKIEITEVINVFCKKLDERYKALKEERDFTFLKEKYLNHLYGNNQPVPVFYKKH